MHAASLKVLSGPRSGRRYGSHVASAPGEPPAADTGTLMGSFRPIQGAPNVAGIETSVSYAGLLEGGTSRMAARPFRERIIKESMPAIIQIMSEPFNIGI